MKHILSAEQFSREEIDSILKSAEELDAVRDESLKGKIIGTVFFEPSTRTRLSFESAAARLGAHTISVADAASSSQSKGETLEDAIRVIGSYVDAIVLRQNEVGGAEKAAAVSPVPLINAGDGNQGQHPTQGLLDLYTIQKELGRLDNVHIAFIGNIKFYRAPRSLSQLLRHYKDIHITFVTTPEMGPDETLKKYLKEHSVSFTETENLASVLPEADVIYQTRVAKEWFPDEAEHKKQKSKFLISNEHVSAMKDGAILMHPLPRIDEIAPEVDASPKAVYFKQAANGVSVRMALLKYVLS